MTDIKVVYSRRCKLSL